MKCQTDKDKYCLLHVESKKQNKQKLSRLDWWLHRGWGMGQMRDAGYKLPVIRQVSSGTLT